MSTCGFDLSMYAVFLLRFRQGQFIRIAALNPLRSKKDQLDGLPKLSERADVGYAHPPWKIQPGPPSPLPHQSPPWSKRTTQIGQFRLQRSLLRFQRSICSVLSQNKIPQIRILPLVTSWRLVTINQGIQCSRIAAWTILQLFGGFLQYRNDNKENVRTKPDNGKCTCQSKQSKFDDVYDLKTNLKWYWLKIPNCSLNFRRYC